MPTANCAFRLEEDESVIANPSLATTCLNPTDEFPRGAYPVTEAPGIPLSFVNFVSFTPVLVLYGPGLVFHIRHNNANLNL